MKRRVVALMGPSGIGKGYIKSSIKKFTELELSEPVVATTREKRPDDDASRQAGLSLEAFAERVQNGDILFPHQPFEDVGTPFYGFEENSLNNSRLLTEIHWTILGNFVDFFERDEMLILAMTADTKFLFQSIKSRGFNSEDIELRVEKSIKEIKQITKGHDRGSIDHLFEINSENREHIQREIIRKSLDWLEHGRK